MSTYPGDEYGVDEYGVGRFGGWPASTTRLYDRLPEHYRDADTGLGWPLLNYLSLLLDQLDPLDELLERIDYDPAEGDTVSDLVDAQGANAAWFPWLAQLLGISLTGLTVDEQRTALRFPRWDHGTPAALEAAAARGLTGSRIVSITRHYDGNPWVIGIGTKDSQTAVPDTFGKLKSWAPSWGELESLGSFAGAAAPTVLAAAEVERPAGYRLVRYSTGA